MKKIFWVLVMGAVASGALAVGLGRAAALADTEVAKHGQAGA